MDGMDDIQRIVPMFCPRCGEKVIFKEDDNIECPACGELYYDPWLGIYRIKPYEDKTLNDISKVASDPELMNKMIEDCMKSK